MPRKPKTTIETLPEVAAKSAAAPRKKRITPRKTTTSTRTATAAARPAKSAAPPADAPKPAAKTKAPKKRAPAAKSIAAPGPARRLKTAVLDDTARYDEIARLAYHLWEQRGRLEGSPEEDWFRAEQEFRQTVRVESD